MVKDNFKDDRSTFPPSYIRNGHVESHFLIQQGKSNFNLTAEQPDVQLTEQTAIEGISEDQFLNLTALCFTEGGDVILRGILQ